MKNQEFFRETITTSEFTTDAGEKYTSITRTIQKTPSRNGLADALIALLSFSVAGLLIYAMWAAAIVLTRPEINYRGNYQLQHDRQL